MTIKRHQLLHSVEKSHVRNLLRRKIRRKPDFSFCSFLITNLQPRTNCFHFPQGETNYNVLQFQSPDTVANRAGNTKNSSHTGETEQRETVTTMNKY